MHCVDLGESFPTSIYLQKSASIQPGTSPPKFNLPACRDPRPSNGRTNSRRARRGNLADDREVPVGCRAVEHRAGGAAPEPRVEFAHRGIPTLAAQILGLSNSKFPEFDFRFQISDFSQIPNSLGNLEIGGAWWRFQIQNFPEKSDKILSDF